MGLGDLKEVEDAFGIKREPPAVRPSVEHMLTGILEAAVLAAGSETKEVTLSIQRNTRTGYVALVDRVTGIGGDEKRSLFDAVESLYLRLADKAAAEERRAGEVLKRLGARK